MRDRYVELDFLRTLAVVMMVIYHISYDLQMFYGWNLGLFESTGWFVLRQATATLFLLLVGCSFAISLDRHQTKNPDAAHRHLYKKYLMRGLGVLACGMLVSAATYWMDPGTYVRFGILHLIGASILLLPFFAGLRGWNVLTGAGILGLQFTIPSVMNTSLLLPLGVMPPDFTSVDYFPLIPWFGIVLIGYSIGYQLYVQHEDLCSSPLLALPSEALAKGGDREGPRVRFLAWPGRHALLLYLIHQPIILGFLVCIGFLSGHQ